MENEVKTFEVYAKAIKDGNKSFIACSALIRDVWYKIKFKRNCKDNITESGMYELTAYVDDLSVEPGKTVTNKSGKKVKTNATIWVDKCVLLRKLTDDELKLRGRARLADVFGE